MNQPRAVVAGDDLDASRKCGLNFGESLLHAIDHRERVHAVAHDDDAADSFAFSVPLGNSFPNVRAKGDGAKVADEDRSAVFRCNRNALEVLERTQVTQTANHVPSAGHFENAATNLIGRIANAVNHHGKRDVVRAKFIGVQIYLILPDEPAHGSNFRNTRNGFELKAEIPVLKAA